MLRQLHLVPFHDGTKFLNVYWEAVGVKYFALRCVGLGHFMQWIMVRV